MPNYHYEDLMHLCELYDQKKLADPAVIVDANHANSGKKYLEQIRICNEAAVTAMTSGSCSRAS